MDLIKIRKKIDKLDLELIKILSKRRDLIEDVIRYKKKNKIPIMQKKRLDSIFKKRKKLAMKFGLDPKFIKHIFWDIINESIKIQKKLMKDRRYV